MTSDDWATVGAALLIIGFMDAFTWMAVEHWVGKPWAALATIGMTALMIWLSRFNHSPQS